MKKKIVFSTLFALTASILMGAWGVESKYQANAETVSDAVEVNTLIDRFYNNGHYVKDTEIY